MSSSFEKTLFEHCTPVLMDLKPANLVAFNKTKIPELAALLRAYTAPLSENGISFEVLCRGRLHDQVLFYRPDALEKVLSRSASRRLLDVYGYDRSLSLSEMLSRLRIRMEAGEDFPHEIGLFLGYPPEDVEGFEKYRGKSCKLSGYWKVYGDEQAARRTFALFDLCRRIGQSFFDQGYTLADLLNQQPRILGELTAYQSLQSA